MICVAFLGGLEHVKSQSLEDCSRPEAVLKGVSPGESSGC
jgi:hypothetical protein